MILGPWAKTRIPTCNFFRENFLENRATKKPPFQRFFSSVETKLQQVTKLRAKNKFFEK